MRPRIIMNNALRVENVFKLTGIMLQSPPLRQLVKEYTHAIQSIFAIFLDAKRIVKIPVVSELERDSIVKRDIHGSSIFLPNAEVDRGEVKAGIQQSGLSPSISPSCSDSSSSGVKPFLDVYEYRGKGTPYPHCELHSQNGRLFFVGKGRDNSTKEFLPSEIEELRKFLSKIDEDNVRAIILQ